MQACEISSYHASESAGFSGCDTFFPHSSAMFLELLRVALLLQQIVIDRKLSLFNQSRSAEDAVLCQGLGDPAWGQVIPSFSTQNPPKGCRAKYENTRLKFAVLWYYWSILSLLLRHHQ